MDVKDFIFSYWKLSTTLISKFHPLSHSFIEKYKYHLQRSPLSENLSIDWTEEFIDQLAEFLYWPYLVRNKAINWTEELKKKHKKRYDNWKLIEAYPNGVKPVFNLEERYENQKFSENEIDNLREILNNQNLPQNKYKFYQEYLLKGLGDQSIEKIFDDYFDDQQKYYLVKVNDLDLKGLIPGFKFPRENNPFYAIDHKLRYGGFPELDIPAKLIEGSYKEGTFRLYDFVRFSGSYINPMIILNDRAKSIIEQFEISKHKFFPIQVKLGKGSVGTNYYMMLLEHDSITKQLDFNEIELIESAWPKGKQHSWPLAIKKKTRTHDIKNFNDLTDTIFQSHETHKKYAPSNYKAEVNFDIFSIERDVIVNEFVKDTLEKLFPNQLKFTSTQHLNISIPEETYNSKSILKLKMGKRNAPNYIRSKKANFYAEKMTRLKGEDPIFKTEIPKDNFQAIQKKLNVIIPKSFKLMYNNDLFKSQEYKLLPIEKFYREDDFSPQEPKAYKAIIVAENGVGDSLGLLLQKDDDYLLQEKLFQFEHDDGSILDFASFANIKEAKPPDTKGTWWKFWE